MLPGIKVCTCVSHRLLFIGNIKYIWKDVNKIIDTLHIRNHKDPGCKIKYSPKILKEEHPTYNTMSCEQTFVWLSRYKKILCAMPKDHFHFYLHRYDMHMHMIVMMHASQLNCYAATVILYRLVKRRNRYIEYCYSNNRRPLLPKV